MWHLLGLAERIQGTSIVSRRQLPRQADERHDLYTCRTLPSARHVFGKRIALLIHCTPYFVYRLLHSCLGACLFLITKLCSIAHTCA